MYDPFFFGYGSLVNTATHRYEHSAPATVRGWRRAWRHTKLRDVAFLTAVPDPQSEIAGLIAHVPNNDWAALDEREFAYTRHALSEDTVVHEVERPLQVQLYQTRSDRDAPPTVSHPILLSYLDVVVQGYLQVFGEEGVERFFDTTTGWDAPILNDREKPNYPRHQNLSAAERDLVDAHLANLSARIELA